MSLVFEYPRIKLHHGILKGALTVQLIVVAHSDLVKPYQGGSMIKALQHVLTLLAGAEEDLDIEVKGQQEKRSRRFDHNYLREGV